VREIDTLSIPNIRKTGPFIELVVDQGKSRYYLLFENENFIRIGYRYGAVEVDVESFAKLAWNRSRLRTLTESLAPAEYFKTHIVIAETIKQNKPFVLAKASGEYAFDRMIFADGQPVISGFEDLPLHSYNGYMQYGYVYDNEEMLKSYLALKSHTYIELDNTFSLAYNTYAVMKVTSDKNQILKIVAENLEVEEDTGGFRSITFNYEGEAFKRLGIELQRSNYKYYKADDEEIKRAAQEALDIGKDFLGPFYNKKW
jgi:hypothetical protein